jgi:hypothetical protein
VSVVPVVPLVPPVPWSPGIELPASVSFGIVSPDAGVYSPPGLCAGSRSFEHASGKAIRNRGTICRKLVIVFSRSVTLVADRRGGSLHSPCRRSRATQSQKAGDFSPEAAWTERVNGDAVNQCDGPYVRSDAADAALSGGEPKRSFRFQY